MSKADQYLAAPTGYRHSASQATTWMACPRKWAWERLVGVPSFPSKSQSLGTEVHHELEVYLKGGQVNTMQEAGRIAVTAFGYLPSPMTPGMEVEKQFNFRAGHRWYGIKDVEMPGRVWDHKTTSGLQWAKTEEELRGDTQAVLYAQDNIIKYRSDAVTVQFTYLQTRRPYQARPVHVTLDKVYLDAAMEVLDDVAEEIEQTAKKVIGIDGDELRAYVLTLDYNVDECEKYNGCPFQGLCNLTPQQRFSAKMKSAKEMGK